MGFKREDTDRILTVISVETKITGVLKSSGTVRVDGCVEGEIDIDGDVIIGEKAIVSAQVKGTNIQVAGKVTGNLLAEKKLEIMATGSVEGDVHVATLQVADGGILKGNCLMPRNTTVSSTAKQQKIQ